MQRKDQTSPSTQPTSAPASGYAPLLLAALLFLLALLVTYSAASGAHRTELAQLERSFDYRARDLTRAIARRMAVYEQVLRGAQGYVRGSVDIEREDFARYYELLKLDQHFPGLQAIAISTVVPPDRLDEHVAAVRREGFPDYRVHPSGTRDLYTAITHIEPFSGRNLRAFGFDMYSEPVRRAAMDAARDTGRAAVSGRVTLVQEGKENVQSGFLMYLPVFERGMPVATVAQRRAALVGWVYAPFRMNDLMVGVGGEYAEDLHVSIYDGTRTTPEHLLYRSPRPVPSDPLFTRTRPIEVAGHTWTVQIRSTPAFEDERDAMRPLLIAVSGIGLGFLLALIVWLLATERRRALQLAARMTHELRQSHDRIEADQQRIRAILHSAYDGFIAVDQQGRITDWNAQAERIFGWNEQEAVGRDAAMLVPEDKRSAHRAGVQRLVQGGGCALLGNPTELTALHRDGRRIPVEVVVAALPPQGGHGATAFVRDITPRKQAEAREQQRQQRLDEARRALARSQKLEAVGKLTGGVAHDFNNLLHIISANVQLILRSGGPRDKRLHSILDAVERGSKLSAQLLAFARRQPLHPSVVNVARLLDRMDSLLQRAAGESVTVTRAGDGDLWNALVDPNQLENVILNLVINARDAMDGKGKVTIRLENVALEPGSFADPEVEPGEYVMIAVSDTGHGMPPEVMERAFEPFFTTKPEGKGTGLGLSMAHGFVRQSGGHIRLSSTPGEGTTVSIYLPRTSAPLPDQDHMPDALAGGHDT